MKVSHGSYIQNLRPTDAPAKKSGNPILNFLRKLLGITPSNVEKKQQKPEEKKPLEHIFEPRPQHHRLTRGEAAMLGEQLSKEFNSEPPKAADNSKQNANVQFLRRSSVNEAHSKNASDA